LLPDISEALPPIAPDVVPTIPALSFWHTWKGKAVLGLGFVAGAWLLFSSVGGSKKSPALAGWKPRKLRGLDPMAEETVAELRGAEDMPPQLSRVLLRRPGGKALKLGSAKCKAPKRKGAR
jgi:hypothetical protein